MKGKVVVITGASAGVGRAAVRLFASRGADLGLIARGREGLEAAALEVRAAGGRACVVCADVADAEAVEEAAARIEEALGPIDVWVNNAGVTVLAPVRRLTAQEVRRVTEVAYLGAVHGTLSALRRMRGRDAGVIVQVGSALNYRAMPLQAPASAAKHAVQGFTESLRTELRHEGSRVRVTMVQLPGLNTPQFEWARVKLTRRPRPQGPVLQPELAARAIVWAALHRRRELRLGLFTGAIILAGKLAPGLADRYWARRGYDCQQTREAALPAGPDNLWEPLPGDRGSRGRFEGASERSVQLWLTTHRRWTAAAGLCAAAVWALRGW